MFVRGIGNIIMGMNDSHQKTCNQYRHLMWEAVKCGDIRSAIRHCDKLISCANEMSSPEKKDRLAKDFIFRGMLNHMCHDNEKAYADFSSALKYSPHNPDALCYRAYVAWDKGPFLQKEFPDHQVISRGWSDISSIERIEKDTGHFAHGMKMWRELLFLWGFFPAITNMNLWRDFCKKFPVLYHVVPERYGHTFSQGLIFFRTFTNLRAEEDSVEGVSHVRTRRDGVTSTQANETEACVFCLSQTPNIVNIRKGGVLYKIKTECFMRNFLHSIEFQSGSFKTPGLKYFGSNQPYENKKLAILVSAGSVIYGGQVNRRPSSFVKPKIFSKEQEVRIAIDLLSSDSRYIDSTSTEHQTLTLRDNESAHIEVPNPSEWQRKM